MEMKKERLAKAKNTKTPEELLCLAQENGEEMTEESAKAYFELSHPQTRARLQTKNLTMYRAGAVTQRTAEKL